MAYAVENLEKLERRVIITLPVDEIDAEHQKRLRIRARTVKAHGFRPGKAPLKMVDQMYGAQINADVLNERVNKAFNEAVAENKLKVAGATFKVDAKTEDVPEGTVQFYAMFEIIPEVEIGDLGALEVEKAFCTITDADVEKMISILREKSAHYYVKGEDSEHGKGNDSDVAESGDRVTIDFVGKIDGVEFDGSKADDYPFILGEKKMLPEFENAVLGMKVGESKTFEVLFPENYYGKDVAGKAAEFTISVKKIEWAHLPELDDEFCRQFGITEGGIDKLREDIKKNLTREINVRISTINRSNVFAKFVEVNTFDVPQVMIEKEIDELIDFARSDLAARNPEHKDDELPRDMFRAQAENRVRLRLLIEKLMKDNNDILTVSQEKLKERAEEFASGFQQPQMIFDYYMNDSKRRQELENVLMEENVVDYIYTRAKVTEKILPFEEVMAQRM